MSNNNVAVRRPAPCLPHRGHPDSMLDLKFLRVACVTATDGNRLHHVSYTVRFLTKRCIYMQLLKIIVKIFGQGKPGFLF